MRGRYWYWFQPTQVQLTCTCTFEVPDPMYNLHVHVQVAVLMLCKLNIISALDFHVCHPRCSTEMYWKEESLLVTSSYQSGRKGQSSSLLDRAMQLDRATSNSSIQPYQENHAQ